MRRIRELGQGCVCNGMLECKHPGSRKVKSRTPMDPDLFWSGLIVVGTLVFIIGMTCLLLYVS